jgi:hypothetical protein
MHRELMQFVLELKTVDIKILAKMPSEVTRALKLKLLNNACMKTTSCT